MSRQNENLEMSMPGLKYDGLITSPEDDVRSIALVKMENVQSCSSFRKEACSQGHNRRGYRSSGLHWRRLILIVSKQPPDGQENIPMTVPRRVTFRPKYTSPVTVK